MITYVYHRDNLIAKFRIMKPEEVATVFQVQTIVNCGDHVVIRIKDNPV